jgi:transposase
MEPHDYASEGLYRFKIIAPLVHEEFPRGELKRRLLQAAARHYEHPARGWERFAAKTIEEWLYKYRRRGLAGLERQRRADHGRSRQVSAEAGELVLSLKKAHPRWSGRLLLRELQLRGVVRPGELSRSAVYRFLQQHGEELRRHYQEGEEKKKYAFANSNECWQSDVCHGPYLRLAGHQQRRKIFLYAFLDDASRLIPHAGIALKENLECFLEFLKVAIQKKGVPGRLYLDNASYYRSPLVATIGARLGFRVLYCTPYSPYKKGKIERWWRTCADQFLTRLEQAKVYTVAELNELLLAWVERDYHHTVHTALQTTPLVAWQAKGLAIRYPDPTTLDRDFLAVAERTVRRDGTFMLQGRYYELDSTLAGTVVEVHYPPFRPGAAYVYQRQGEFIGEARVVREVDNQQAGRRRLAPPPEANRHA